MYSTNYGVTLYVVFSSLRPFVTLRNLFCKGEALLVPRPTTNLKDHLLSAVRDSLFRILTATLYMYRSSPPSVT